MTNCIGCGAEIALACAICGSGKAHSVPCSFVSLGGPRVDLCWCEKCGALWLSGFTSGQELKASPLSLCGKCEHDALAHVLKTREAVA